MEEQLLVDSSNKASLVILDNEDIPDYENDSKKHSKAKPSLRDSECYSVCSVCLQEFPYPFHFPENHPVIPFQEKDKYPGHPESLLSRLAPEGHDESSRASYAKTGTRSLLTGDETSQPGSVAYQSLRRLGFNPNPNPFSLGTNMGGEIPLIPKARSMFLHSGNILNWNRLKKKPNQTSTEEVCECIEKTLGSYLETQDKTNLQYVTEIYKVNSENIQPMDEHEREEVKITVKMFICGPQPPKVIGEAVEKVLNELGTTYVETLLLAVSPEKGDDEDAVAPSLSTIQPYWEAMEELVSADKVLSLGISDLTKDELEALYNWAKIKPSIDQVNLESCCVMPQDLTEYAKSVNVQLLTHNDRPVFTSEEVLQEKICNVSTKADSLGWSPRWVVRYSGILKCRGIIKMKGYIFHAQRSSSKLFL